MLSWECGLLTFSPPPPPPNLLGSGLEGLELMAPWAGPVLEMSCPSICAAPGSESHASVC